MPAKSQKSDFNTKSQNIKGSLSQSLGFLRSILSVRYDEDMVKSKTFLLTVAVLPVKDELPNIVKTHSHNWY